MIKDLKCGCCGGSGQEVDWSRSYYDEVHHKWNIAHKTCGVCAGSGKLVPVHCPHGYEDWDQCPDCCH